MRIRSHQFNKLAKDALHNERLQRNIAFLGDVLLSRREQAFSTMPDPEGLREQGRRIRERSISRLPQLLEELERRVTESGGKVHWARTAARAREIVLEVVRATGTRRIVKGKSMVSEEISLNEALIQQGLEVSETDLGEFIVQLANEPPFHIVGPAIHKSVEEISELFSEKLGTPKSGDPRELTLIARRHLREAFLTADMGITGVNMAVAETGTLVLVENEGNIRMSTTLPRVHVAIMGIEKVVPTLNDMAVLLALLPRSSTGQKLSAYTSFISGPRDPSETDGCRELHLIIVDNGRSRILRDPDRRESLYCIRCGLCLNVCPVYRKVGGHSYGWVYSGPIGSVLTPQLIPPRLARELPFASTLCGACAEVCPVKIDIPKLLLLLRWRLQEDPAWDGGLPIMEKMAMDTSSLLFRSPSLYRVLSKAVRWLQHVLAPRGKWRILPPPFSYWTRSRSIPALPPPFSKKWPTLRQELRVESEDDHRRP
jgi:L-lactate dehydrogenase complex protein LldF